MLAFEWVFLRMCVCYATVEVQWRGNDAECMKIVPFLGVVQRFVSVHRYDTYNRLRGRTAHGTRRRRRRLVARPADGQALLHAQGCAGQTTTCTRQPKRTVNKHHTVK